MSYRIRVLPEARAEAEAAADGYEARRPGLGQAAALTEVRRRK
jgi:hypothetical protein